MRLLSRELFATFAPPATRRDAARSSRPRTRLLLAGRPHGRRAAARRHVLRPRRCSLTSARCAGWSARSTARLPRTTRSPGSSTTRRGRIGLRFDPDRHLAAGDPTRRDLLLGLGAFVETVLIVAAVGRCRADVRGHAFRRADRPLRDRRPPLRDAVHARRRRAAADEQAQLRPGRLDVRCSPPRGRQLGDRERAARAPDPRRAAAVRGRGPAVLRVAARRRGAPSLASPQQAPPGLLSRRAHATSAWTSPPSKRDCSRCCCARGCSRSSGRRGYIVCSPRRERRSSMSTAACSCSSERATMKWSCSTAAARCCGSGSSCRRPACSRIRSARSSTIRQPRPELARRIGLSERRRILCVFRAGRSEPPPRSHRTK